MTGRSKEALARSQKLIADAASQGFGPHIELARQRVMAKELHAAGVSMADIATLFEVSAEQARMWVRGTSSKPLTDAEWQLVQWLRSNKIEAGDAQAALHTARGQYAQLGRR